MGALPGIYLEQGFLSGVFPSPFLMGLHSPATRTWEGHLTFFTDKSGLQGPWSQKTLWEEAGKQSRFSSRPLLVAMRAQGRMQAQPWSEQDSRGVRIRAQGLYCSACWKLYPLGSVSLKSHSKIFGEAERSLDLKEQVWIEILNAFNVLSPHVKHDLNWDMCCLTQMIAVTVTLTSLAPERSHPSNTSSKQQKYMPVEKLTHSWHYLCFLSRLCQDTLLLWRFDPAQFRGKKIKINSLSLNLSIWKAAPWWVLLEAGHVLFSGKA